MMLLLLFLILHQVYAQPIDTPPTYTNLINDPRCYQPTPCDSKYCDTKYRYHF